MSPRTINVMAIVVLLLVCLFSIGLIVLKLAGLLAISWILALCPIPIFVISYLGGIIVAALVESFR